MTSRKMPDRIRTVNVPKKRKNSFLEHWQLYLFLLLPLIWLMVFKYYPMLGAQIAFKDFKPMQGIWGSKWVGLKNFRKFFSSYQFPRVMKNTLTLSFYMLLASFPIPIILALVLNSMRSKRFRNAVETIAYMPHFISIVVLVGMMMQMFNPHIGVLGSIYRTLIGKDAPNLFGDPDVFPHLYVWSAVWQDAGWGTIIYTAALAGVDPELHEAAQIDGASRFRRMLHIDLPTIMSTVTIMLILNLGSIMSIGFEKAYLMQTDLNLRSSEIISTYVYKVSFIQGSDFAYASAVGLFNSVINMCMLVIGNTISRKVSDNSLW